MKQLPTPHPSRPAPPAGLYRSRAFDPIREIERRRRLLAGKLDPVGTQRWLSGLGIGSGSSVLDVGCGIGWRSAVLAGAVAPGPLIGVDVHEELLSASAAHAHESGLTNATFLCCDAARVPLPDARFDLVTCVAVLWTLPDPEAVVAEMARLAKPGALLHSREPDAGSLPIRHPPLPPEVARVNESFFAFVERHGGTQFMGRQLFDLYLRAGLRDVRLTVRTSYQTGPSTQPASNWEIIEQWETELIEEGYLSPGDLAAARAIEAHYLRTPGLFELYCSYEVTGRKPETA